MIVAGWNCPDADDARWRVVARRLPLGPISEAAHWEPWLERRYPNFRNLNVDIPTLIMASQGVPKTFSELCRTIALGPHPST